MTEKRNRSAILDASLVRMHAAAMKIYNKRAFESKFYQFHHLNEFREVGNAPGKAWDGKNPQFKQAQQVAEFLGLNHFSQLQLNNAESRWSNLLADPQYSQQIFQLRLDEEDDEWRAVDYVGLYGRNFDQLTPYSIDAKWHVVLKGKTGDSFALFLQTDKSIDQIAPMEHESCKSTISKKIDTIAIPPQPVLGFDKNEGTGWRRFIVVRAKHLPLPPKSQNTGHLISAQELELFATRLLQEKNLDIAVDTYEFVLE